MIQGMGEGVEDHKLKARPNKSEVKGQHRYLSEVLFQNKKLKED